MDSKYIKEKVLKPKLAESFGNMLASTLLLKASSECMMIHDDKAKAKKMIEIICSDPKITNLWGASLAMKQKTEWLGML